MNRYLFLLSFLFLAVLSGNAQQLSWSNSHNISELDMTVDDSGNIFYVGINNATYDFDPGPSIQNAGGSYIYYYVVCLDANGNFNWVQTLRISDSVQGFDARIEYVNGKIIFAGYSDGAITTASGSIPFTTVSKGIAFICLNSSNGSYIWGKTTEDTSGTSTYVFDLNTANPTLYRSLFLDVSSNLVKIGFNFVGSFDAIGPSSTSTIFTSTSGSSSIAILTYAILNGSFIPSGSFKLEGDSNLDINGLRTDNSGAIYVAGNFSGTVDLNPGSAINSSNAGTEVWNSFLAKYSAQGVYSWHQAITTTGSIFGITVLRELDLDQFGNPVVLGFIKGSYVIDNFGTQLSSSNLTPNGGADVFLIKYSSNGIGTSWVKTLPPVDQTPGNFNGFRLSDMEIATDGSILITGEIRGLYDFDPGINQVLLGSDPIDGSVEKYIAYYQGNGSLNWAVHIPSSLSSEAVLWDNVKFYGTNTFYTSGDFNDYVDLDPSFGLALYNTGRSYRAKYSTSPIVNDPCELLDISINEGLDCMYNFNASYSGSCTDLSYSWTFGDGTNPIPSGIASQSHTYTLNGSYQVCLEISCNSPNSFVCQKCIGIEVDCANTYASGCFQISHPNRLDEGKSIIEVENKKLFIGANFHESSKDQDQYFILTDPNLTAAPVNIILGDKIAPSNGKYTDEVSHSFYDGAYVYTIGTSTFKTTSESDITISCIQVASQALLWSKVYDFSVSDFGISISDINEDLNNLMAFANTKSPDGSTDILAFKIDKFTGNVIGSGNRIFVQGQVYDEKVGDVSRWASANMYGIAGTVMIQGKTQLAYFNYNGVSSLSDLNIFVNGDLDITREANAIRPHGRDMLLVGTASNNSTSSEIWIYEISGFTYLPTSRRQIINAGLNVKLKASSLHSLNPLYKGFYIVGTKEFNNKSRGLIIKVSPIGTNEFQINWAKESLDEGVVFNDIEISGLDVYCIGKIKPTSTNSEIFTLNFSDSAPNSCCLQPTNVALYEAPAPSGIQLTSKITPVVGSNFNYNTNYFSSNGICIDASNPTEFTNNGNFAFQTSSTVEKTVLYPNPSSGIINVSSQGCELIRIYTMEGVQLFEQKTGSESVTTEIDLTHLSSGIYIVQTILGDKTSNQKLVIQK